ncbi:MAG: hypothetical protein ABH879_09165 [archaeon]
MPKLTPEQMKNMSIRRRNLLYQLVDRFGETNRGQERQYLEQLFGQLKSHDFIHRDFLPKVEEIASTIAVRYVSGIFSKRLSEFAHHWKQKGIPDRGERQYFIGLQDEIRSGQIMPQVHTPKDMDKFRRFISICRTSYQYARDTAARSQDTETLHRLRITNAGILHIVRYTDEVKAIGGMADKIRQSRTDPHWSYFRSFYMQRKRYRDLIIRRYGDPESANAILAFFDKRNEDIDAAIDFFENLRKKLTSKEYMMRVTQLAVNDLRVIAAKRTEFIEQRLEGIRNGLLDLVSKRVHEIDVGRVSVISRLRKGIEEENTQLARAIMVRSHLTGQEKVMAMLISRKLELLRWNKQVKAWAAGMRSRNQLTLRMAPTVQQYMELVTRNSREQLSIAREMREVARRMEALEGQLSAVDDGLQEVVQKDDNSYLFP